MFYFTCTYHEMSTYYLYQQASSLQICSYKTKIDDLKKFHFKIVEMWKNQII
jgi:hypothetical protein